MYVPIMQLILCVNDNIVIYNYTSIAVLNVTILGVKSLTARHATGMTRLETILHNVHISQIYARKTKLGGGQGALHKVFIQFMAK